MEKRAFKRIPVKSSNIKFIGHSYPRRMLEVGFNNGSVYRYKGVPNKVYKELLNAESKGKAFHYLIRSKYPYKQTIDKNGDKVNGGYKKMAMRNFDEFIKTAGIFQTYADALTGRNVDKAQKRYARTVNNFDKAKQISERMERNRAGARLNLSNAEVNRDANRRAIQESLDKTKEWANNRKIGNTDVSGVTHDSYGSITDKLKEATNKIKRSKLNFNERRLENKAAKISERMDKDNSKADQMLRNVMEKRDTKRKAIQESLDKTKEWLDMANNKKPGNRSVSDMVYDSYKDMKNNGKEAANRAKRKIMDMDNVGLNNEAIQISDRMSRNNFKATQMLKDIEKKRGENKKAIQESLNKTEAWMNNKKPGNRSFSNMVSDGYTAIKNNGREAVNRAKRSKLNFNDKKLSNAVDEAKSTFQTAANKAGKASSLVDKKYNDVLKAQGGIKRAKVGSIAAKGATVAGLAGAAMIGKKLYNKYKNGDFKRQENTQPQYQTHTIQPQSQPQYQVNPYQQY